MYGHLFGAKCVLGVFGINRLTLKINWPMSEIRSVAEPEARLKQCK